MTRMQRLLMWTIILFGFFLLVHALRDMMFPFIAGLAVAYFLDPTADKLEAAGCSRVVATSIIILSFFAIAVGGLVLLFPVLQTQVLAVGERIPDVIDLVRSLADRIIEKADGLIPADAMQRASDAAGDNSAVLVGWLKTFLSRLWNGGTAFFGVISIIIIMPIVSFYMLLEWDNIVAKIDSLLPRNQAKTIREQLSLMDQTISAFVRGQASVCLVLATYYGISLSVVGLEAGLIIGIGAGIASFIPYVGALVGISVGVGIAMVQFGDVSQVLTIAAIFIVGQVTESYILTPRLVGGKVGLHDLWIIFALMAGGSLFGFTGVLLAIPTAAVIGVLIRFTLSRYLESPLYHGHSHEGDDVP